MPVAASFVVCVTPLHSRDDRLLLAKIDSRAPLAMFLETLAAQAGPQDGSKAALCGTLCCPYRSKPSRSRPHALSFDCERLCKFVVPGPSPISSFLASRYLSTIR